MMIFKKIEKWFFIFMEVLILLFYILSYLPLIILEIIILIGKIIYGFFIRKNNNEKSNDKNSIKK